MNKLIFLYLLIIPFSFADEDKVRANVGILNFNEIKLNKNDFYDLKGEWLLYWNKWLNPQEIKKGSLPKATTPIKIPSPWISVNSRELKNEIPAVGIASLLIEIKGISSNNLSLFLEQIKSSFKVFIIQNGKTLKTYSRGRISKKKDLSQVSEEKSLFKLPKIEGNFFLLFHISNFQHFSGGLQRVPIIGKNSFLEKRNKINDFKNIFFLGVLLVLSIFYFFTFIIKKIGPIPGYFSGFCFLLFIHMLLKENYLLFFINGNNELYYEIKSRIQYGSYFSSIVFVYYFFHDIFFYLFKNNIFRFISAFSITYGIVALLTPPFFHTNPLFMKSWIVINLLIFSLLFIMTLKVILKKSNFSKVALLSLLFVCLDLVSESFFIQYLLLGSMSYILFIRTSLRDKILEKYKTDISKEKEYADMIFSIFENPKEFITLIDHCRSNFNLKENYENILDMAFFSQIIFKIRLGLETFKCFSLATYFRDLEELAKKHEEDVFTWEEMPENLKSTFLLCQDALTTFIEKNEIIETQIKTNEELKRTGDQLKKALEDKVTFFAKMSHELRTPLNAILGFSNILLGSFNKDQELEKDVSKEYLNCISSSGQSLLGLIGELHDLTKLDLNKLKIVTGPVPLFQLLNNISTFFVNECAKKNLSFFFELSDNVPDRIIFDDLRLKQILNNLLSNALKFTKKGHIKMSVWCTSSHEEKNRINLNFKIEDTGIGMKPSGVEKLFKSFEQVHEEGSIEERGSGLGLYISKKLIDQMNGSIDVKSIFSIGTSFKVSFKNIEPVAVIGDINIEDSFHYNFFGKTVLIADDLDINLKLLEAYISDSNLKIEKAKNGQELIEKSVAHEPVLIITDIKMPTMDGYLAAKKLNSIKKTKDIPIIALTAAPDKEGIRGDFKSFLQKPVNKLELLTEISKYIECEKINKKSGKKESFVPTIEIYESKTSFDLNTTNLKTSDIAFLQKLLRFCEETLDLMEINAIEDSCQEFQKEIANTNFSNLSLWFEALENDTKLFKIDAIEEKVKSGIPVIKETIEAINKKA